MTNPDRIENKVTKLGDAIAISKFETINHSLARSPTDWQGYVGYTAEMIHWEGNMKTGPKWAVNKIHDLLYTELVIPALFFSSNSHISGTKRARLDPLAPNRPQRAGLSFPLSRKWPRPTLSSSFGLFLKESTFSGCSRWAKVGHYGPKHAPGTQWHPQKGFGSFP